MRNWERLLYQKKTEFWIRLAQASLTLYPAEKAPLLERIFYRNLAKLGNRFFLKCAVEEIAAERTKMAQEECKHDMAPADAAFCPGCGKQISADPEVEAALERSIKRVLNSYGITPKPAPKGKETPAPKSLSEKLFSKKK